MQLNDILNHKDFHFALGAFLDEFYRSENRAAMIQSPPDKTLGTIQELTTLAAIVETLSNEYQMDVPIWAYGSDFRLPEPFFAFNTQNNEYRTLLLETTPKPFADRNLFYGEIPFGRV